MSDLYQFRFLGGPLDDMDNSAPAFEALGYASASWARLELHIDALLVQVNKVQHSERLFDPDHPVSFSRKLRLLKRWFNQYSGLAPYKNSMREITSRVKALGTERNKFVHSIFDHYDEATQTVTLRSFQFVERDRMKVSRHTATLDTLISFAVVVNQANRALAEISVALFTEGAVARLRKS